MGEYLLVLLLFEYCFRRVTNLSKSSWRSWRPSRDRFWSSGLYFCLRNNHQFRLRSAKCGVWVPSSMLTFNKGWSG